MLDRICHLSWMKVAIDQCFVPGPAITFRSRATPLGQRFLNELVGLFLRDAPAAGKERTP